MSLGMILAIAVQAVSDHGWWVFYFFNPAGVWGFSKSLLCFQLCASSGAGVVRGGCRAFCPSFSPDFPSSPLSCRCLGEDALRAIRPPPREACLSLSAFLSVLRAKDALEARAHSPSLHSEPAAAICQLLLFPKKKPATDPGLSGSERPRLQDRGNGLSIAEGRALPRPPRPLCSPFLHFRMGLRMRRRRCGPLPGTGRLETRPKGTGGPCTPGCCLRGAAGEPRHRRRLGTKSWCHLRCRWQPGPAH